MKKKLTILLLFILVTSLLFAQKQANRGTIIVRQKTTIIEENPIVGNQIKRNGTKYNIYNYLTGNYVLMEDSSVAKNIKKLTIKKDSTVLVYTTNLSSPEEAKISFTRNFAQKTYPNLKGVEHEGTITIKSKNLTIIKAHFSIVYIYVNYKLHKYFILNRYGSNELILKAIL